MAPWADVLYACDLRWWDAYGTEAAAFAGERWTCDRAAAAKHGAQWIDSCDDAGLCLKPGRIHTGSNSGYQAIGLAHEWGARRVVLLGYDMQRTGGASHWHGDHAAGLPNLGHLPSWIRRMAVLAADLRTQGVDVVNASAETALTCFERKPLRAALGTDLPPLLIDGMQGLGDNLYQRPVLREILATGRTVYLSTAWPQLYADLPVRCVRPLTRLRTQSKNVRRLSAWHTAPRGAEPLRWTYAGQGGTILGALCEKAGVHADKLDFAGPPVERVARAPYVVVRPATIRAEWRADGRNPQPEYIARAAATLRECGYRIISVADLRAGEEWALPPLPVADETYHAGELPIERLLALVAGAAAVVGGVGWLVPAAVAYRVPMLLLFGGWGRDNGPQRIFDPRMDTSLIHQALPDRWCVCGDRAHACDKTISNLDEHLERFTLRLAQSPRAAMAA